MYLHAQIILCSLRACSRWRTNARNVAESAKSLSWRLFTRRLPANRFFFLVTSTFDSKHPRRPRGYQPGRCDIFGRKFTSRAEQPLGTYSKNNSVEIAYVSYKKFTYDISSINPPRKLMEEYWLLFSMLQLAISSAWLNIFFLKLSTTIFPFNGPSNLVDR